MSDTDAEILKDIIESFDKIVLYRKVLSDPVISAAKRICGENAAKAFSKISEITAKEAERAGYSGNILEKYLFSLFLYDENIFSLYCENNADVQNTSLYRLALNDIKILKSLVSADFLSLYKKAGAAAEIFDYKPVNAAEGGIIDKLSAKLSPEEIIEIFIKFYNVSGCGDISRFCSFKYDGGTNSLLGIGNPDKVTFDDIIGYENQTKELIENTRSFLKGFPANNVLLAGSRGTGKSSSVKALSNEFYKDGLRVVEIAKEQILNINELIETLKGRGKKFIIFIDDLSFDGGEIQYKHMKSLIDGGFQKKPENVLFYATSNRRRLISEKWGDRKKGSDDEEIHLQDTLNEKLSLSDRFGMTIFYPKPTPAEYINMVKVMAKKRGISIEDEILEKEAFKWEINQKGISGRTAKQFIDYIEGSVKKNEGSGKNGG